jgi:hypothetical protein
MTLSTLPVLAWGLAGPIALPAPVTTFPLSIAVAADAPAPADGSRAPAVDDAWLTEQIAVAQSLFTQFGVQFERAKVRALDAKLAHLETRADRDALAAHAEPQVINVFVVASLRDIDDPRRVRRGVHWHARLGTAGAHYVVVVSGAAPSVLAHELGHFFGNPHSKVLDNVMSYERSGAEVFFDDDQGRRIAGRARTYVTSGEIVPLGAAKPSPSW